MRRLLIMACSQRKKPDTQLLPAIERYDGPSYRVLRRFLRNNNTNNLDTRIVSAKFGLISDEYLIPSYDERMTTKSARHLQPLVIAELERLIHSQTYHELYVAVGKDYLRTMEGLESFLSSEIKWKVAEGSQGKRLAELYNWLYDEIPAPKRAYSSSEGRNSAIRIRGVTLHLTAEEALDKARAALQRDLQNASRYHAWYVPIGEYRVAPKWLVSQLTGLPVARFVTDEARRVLNSLGIEVRRL